MNGYNLLAPFYDILVKVVFGNKIKEIQITHLHKIPKNSNVLILGGGTGWILQEIDKRTTGATITYIDLSSKMIQKSKSRKVSNNVVRFIEGTENDIPDIKYDVLITNFYLDLFPKQKLTKVIQQLGMLNCQLWIWTDFVPNKSYWWLEKTMILFFKCITGLSNDKLYHYDALITEQTVYKKEVQEVKMNGFLVSALMMKEG